MVRSGHKDDLVFGDGNVAPNDYAAAAAKPAVLVVLRQRRREASEGMTLSPRGRPSRSLLSRPGLRRLSFNALACFGVASGLVQLATAIRPLDLSGAEASAVILALIVLSLSWGLFRAWPRQTVSRHFGLPAIQVTVTVGDLFDAGSDHLVIGFSDTFAIDTTQDRVISSTSVQGQFLTRVYANDQDRLKTDLDKALKGAPSLRDPGDHAVQGEAAFKRYNVGTVAVLREGTRNYYCVAYAIMDRNMKARSSIDTLWLSLDKLWRAVQDSGDMKPLSTTILGSGHARINQLDRINLLRILLLSFIARSRQEPITRHLTIWIKPEDASLVNMLAVEDFLRSI